MQEKIKKLLFYIIWALVLSYLYMKFAEIKPFEKDSYFQKSSCKSKSLKSDKIIKYKALSEENNLYKLDEKR